MPSEDDAQLWAPVIARSLARIALVASKMEEKSISEKAAFLQSLGMEKTEIASMLGSSPASIAELLRQRSKKGATNGQESKSSGAKARRK